MAGDEIFFRMDSWGEPTVSNGANTLEQLVPPERLADPQLGGSQIRRFLILHKELDADDGELTRTRKVRRNFIADRYSELIDALYSDRAMCHVATEVTFEDGRKGVIEADLRILDAGTFPVAEAIKKAS